LSRRAAMTDITVRTIAMMMMDLWKRWMNWDMVCDLGNTFMMFVRIPFRSRSGK